MREIHGRRQKVILTLQTLRRLGVLLSGPSIYDKKSPVSLLWKIKIRMQSKNDFYNDIIFLIGTVTRVTTLSSEKCVQIPHNFTTILWPNISPCWDFQLLGVKLAWLITRCLYCAARREFSIQLHHRQGQGTLAHRHTAHRASVGSPEERSGRPCMLAWSGVNSSHKTISLSLSWQSAGAAQWWVVFWYEFLSVSLACLPRDDLLAGGLTMFCPSKTGKSISCHFGVFVASSHQVSLQVFLPSGMTLGRVRVL